MKRFFTFLMAVMALLAYATNVKAENVYLLTDQPRSWCSSQLCQKPWPKKFICSHPRR